MATMGDCVDRAHIICITGDGANLTHGSTGVRVAFFCGSTEFLNQSSNDVTDLVMYQEASKAEDYTILQGRLAEIRPALQRLYSSHELCPGGVRSGVFVNLCLVADKPFIRHVCGLLSHNADAFGSPFCNCTDKELYNFERCKRTHYGQISFETLCSRAHVPVWEALGQAEPQIGQ
mmetsp:Transcript_9321/g.19486  ORF Transcript_9321/g.19486 Transcript_9321/m.19486 type:complete len:176 (+) Transcript_9321:429-956(+)